METKVNIERMALRSGVLIFLGFVVYFALMKYLDLFYIIELRMLNFLILAGGILLTINHYKNSSGERIAYAQGFVLGFLTTVVAVGLFALFIDLYLNWDDSFMQFIKGNAMMGSYLTPSLAAIAICVEGISSGFIFTLMCMQYFKKFETHHLQSHP